MSHDRVDERPVDDAHQQRRQQHDQEQREQHRARPTSAADAAAHSAGRSSAEPRWPSGAAAPPSPALDCCSIDTPACLTCLSARPCYQPTAAPSRRGSAPPVSTPLSGSIATPWPPPTFQVHSVQHVDLVAARPQPVQASRRDPPLGVDQRPLERSDARRLDAGLDVQAEVEAVQEHLERRLEDAERAGRPDAEDRLAVSRDDAGRHRASPARRPRRHVVRALRVEVRASRGSC